MDRRMGPHRNVLSLPLHPDLRNRLLAAGFQTIQDLMRFDAVLLMKEARLASLEDAAYVLKVCTYETKTKYSKK